MSLFFGYFLSLLEAPLEVVTNNEIIAARSAYAYGTHFMNNLTINTPQICAKLYFSNLTDDDLINQGLDLIEDILVESIDAVLTSQPAVVLSNESVPTVRDQMNASDLINFAGKCGTYIFNEAMNLSITTKSLDTLNTVLSDVSFNWIRCDSTRKGNESAASSLSSIIELVWNPFGAIDRLRPSAQEQTVVQHWNAQQQQLYEVYLAFYVEQGERPLEARSNAFFRSFDEATGFNGCFPNTSGAAWFWFTVMTTIGYGNVSPRTEGGQAMIFTFGFLCILFFGVVLAQSGTIITAIFDDWVERVHLSWLTIPSVACVFWGCLYYGWMLIIAAYTQEWKQFRLEEEFQFGTAYWFSFISTTTVGLGDYFLEHSLILPVDLVAFSILFLLGFSLLSNFLVKLSELVVEIIGLRGPSLAEALRKTNAPCCPPFPQISTKGLSLRHRRKAKVPARSPETVDDCNAANTNAFHSGSDLRVSAGIHHTDSHDSGLPEAGSIHVENGWLDSVSTEKEEVKEELD